MTYRILDNQDIKICKSDDYNFVFNKKTGMFARWGSTKEEDPDMAPGAEILDIEVTDICHGVVGLDGNRKPCNFCYKSNGPSGKNMSLKDFQTIINKFPKTLTQIAFGVDSLGTSNPELFDMMQYCRSIGIIPNVTLADISDEVADKCVKLCGAVAVSRYANKDVCYDSIKKLTDRGLKSVNMHHVIHQDNFLDVIDTINDIQKDKRLSKLNAIVFLSLKQKGRGQGFKPMSFGRFKLLIDMCLEKGVNFGMDSCSACKFLEVIKDHPRQKELEQLVEKCESGLFSVFVDVEGKMWPCSFGNNKAKFEPIDILKLEGQDFWQMPQWKEWRSNLLGCQRNCPLYSI